MIVGFAQEAQAGHARSGCPKGQQTSCNACPASYSNTAQRPKSRPLEEALYRSFGTATNTTSHGSTHPANGRSSCRGCPQHGQGRAARADDNSGRAYHRGRYQQPLTYV
jgi:hypothetical protein